MRKELLTGLLSFTAGLLVYHLVLVERPPETVPPASIKKFVCPTEETFSDYWNTWSFDYLTMRPGVDIYTQLNDWRLFLESNECNLHWHRKIVDLIEQNSVSGTPVYWTR